MEVKSLRDLTLQKIADFLEHGKLKIRPLHIGDHLLPINTRMSNQIIKKHHEEYPMSTTPLDEFKKLSITSVAFENRTNLYIEKFVKMCKTQNIREFTFRRYSLSYSSVYDKDGFDLNGLLNDALKDPRRLRYLDVYHVERQYLKTWLPKIGESFHDLETLKVSENSMNCNTLSLMATRFPNLKELEIQLFDMPNLKGIQNFRNLTSLIYYDACGRYQNASEIIDLFEMKTLERLDISTHGDDFDHNKFMDSFLECGKSIQELNYLNCANHNLDENGLRKLVQRQPKLRTIVIVGTAAQNIDIPGVKLFKDTTFRNCRQSLEHLLVLKKEKLLSDICRKLSRIDRTGENDEEFLRLLHVLYDVLEEIKQPGLHVKIFHCFHSFQRKNYLRSLSVSAKLMLSHQILNSDHRINDLTDDDDDDDDDGEIVIYEKRYRFFCSDDVLLNPGWNIPWIFEQVVNQFTSGVIELSETSTYHCIHLIDKLMSSGRLSNDILCGLAKSDSFLECVMKFLFEDFRVYQIEFNMDENVNSAGLRILNRLTSTKEFVSLCRFDVENLFDLVETYWRRPELMVKVLKVLLNLDSFSDIYASLPTGLAKELIDSMSEEAIGHNYGSNDSNYLACTFFSSIICRGNIRDKKFIKTLNENVKTAIQKIRFDQLTHESDLPNYELIRKIRLDYETDGPIFWMLMTLKRGLTMHATWLQDISLGYKAKVNRIVNARKADKKLVELAEEVAERIERSVSV